LIDRDGANQWSSQLTPLLSQDRTTLQDKSSCSDDQKETSLTPGESVDYCKAREALLAEEIEFRRHMTRLTEQRPALPRVL